MEIAGLHKLSLLDYPDKLCCIVFTGGCNLRCPFCHNASLVLPEKVLPCMEEQEFFTFLKNRTKRLDGVCITGGEPLLSQGIERFLLHIKELGFLVKLDTNGTLPDRLANLIQRGLVDYIAMDIKNCAQKYARTVGFGAFSLEPIKKSVKLIMESGLDYEFRTTVVNELHTESDFKEIKDLIAGAKRYVLQEFVESEEMIGSGFHACTLEEMKAFGAIVKKAVSFVELRGIK